MSTTNERTGQAGEAQDDFCALTPEEREAVIRADTARAVPRAHSVTLSQWEYDTIRAALSRLSSATTTDAVAVAWINPMALDQFASGRSNKEWAWAKPEPGDVPLFAAPPRLQPEAAPDSPPCEWCGGSGYRSFLSGTADCSCVPTPPVASRVCEFCGCRTNAKLRACCDRGRSADATPPADDARDAVLPPQPTGEMLAALDTHAHGHRMGFDSGTLLRMYSALRAAAMKADAQAQPNADASSAYTAAQPEKKT